MAIDFTYVIESAQNVQESISTTIATCAEIHQATSEAMQLMDSVTDSRAAIQDTAESFAQKKLGAFIGAGVAMIGASGVGAGQGYAAGAAALAVARNPEMKSQIMSTAIVGMAIAESSSIYSLIIAILLIFVAA